MQNKIEKLEYYSSSTIKNPHVWIRHPNEDDIVDKINEIIEYINNKEDINNAE